VWARAKQSFLVRARAISELPPNTTTLRGCAWGLYALGLMQRTYRVVVAKPGLDGHDRGAKVIARTLRDAGFEVVYTGLHQTPEQIVQAVIQEDADALGLSLLSGAHLVLVPRVIDLLKSEGRGDVLLLVGGIIPDDDIAGLESWRGAGLHARRLPGRDRHVARVDPGRARAPALNRLTTVTRRSSS
jgi:methylmalonyl-CoA mutase C-terminal domain/subunit